MDDEAGADGSGAVRLQVTHRPSPYGRRWPPSAGRNGAPAHQDSAPGRHDGGPARPPRATYAALDLGTNNCRLLVARPTGESFRVVDAFSRIIRLGEGVSVSGILSESAIERAFDALSICRDKMVQRGVTRARLIATEACRAAANGADFLARVRERVGIKLEIVDRETEALLAASGCTPLIDPRVSGVLVFDIGGGSSELIRLGRAAPVGNGPPLPQVQAWVSLPVGVVTLAERYGGIAVDRTLFETMVGDVQVFVERFAADQARAEPDMHMLGTSGTVTTICGVHLGLKRYDRRQVDGCWMSESEVSGVVEQLLDMSYEERAQNGCIGRERADLVLAGCAILEAIRRVFPCRRLRIADRGLREGMLVQMMREDGVWAAPEPAL
jgi:exopolyphosphatase/guanosine-5'-triphosphate,3'-diphosphate pyrophosphatase